MPIKCGLISVKTPIQTIYINSFFSMGLHLLKSRGSVCTNSSVFFIKYREIFNLCIVFLLGQQEDCKKSDRGEEQVRTEVIQGQAPDSQFQIVRSHSHFHTENDNLNSSLVQSSSTSYQMSSSRGVRSTSKVSKHRKNIFLISHPRTNDMHK